MAWLALGWILMFLVGLADDLWDLPPLVKLAGEALAALAAVAGAGLLLAPAGGTEAMGLTALAGVAAAVVWILFFANGYNFMDGMDGFAGSFAREASLAMFAVALVGGWRLAPVAVPRSEALLMPVLAVACWGFLAWNNPPAKVFMGDGGSLSVGYLLAVWPLLGVGGRLGAPLPWVTSMTILMPFTFDVALTLVRRLRRGENVLKAHREHLYQRLIQTGLTHAQVLALTKRRFHACAALAVAGALLASRPARWLCLILSVAVMLQYWSMTLQRERRQAAEPAASEGGQQE
jgi:UDP-N-acetylmuramyl pentapeptide phosphotransferase/UDP-N-acetylglucosamine-1-phosphate transferase